MGTQSKIFMNTSTGNFNKYSRQDLQGYSRMHCNRLSQLFRAITTSELTKDFNKDVNGYVRRLLQETLTSTSGKGPTRVSKATSDHIKNSSNELINRSVFKCL